LGIGTGGLGLRDTEENDLLSFLDPVQNLRVIKIAEPQPHNPRLQAARGFHERDLRAIGAPGAAG